MKKAKPVLGDDPLSWMDTPATAPTPAADAVTAPSAGPEAPTDQAPAAGSVLVLPEDLTVRAVGALHAQLLAFAPADAVVTVDAAAVALVDTAGVQLLLAWLADCRERDLEVRWRGVPTVLASVGDTLGLSERLALASTAEA
ncbi:MAG TPA: STAS domain-containing protein [Pseudomonadales bacterium]|nr:STAS domain-containing protein [Pseudomonadales bacterium]